MEFKKIVDYVEVNKKEYLDRELAENRKKRRDMILERSIKENREALKKLAEE